MKFEDRVALGRRDRAGTASITLGDILGLVTLTKEDPLAEIRASPR
jgi:hypothetical protein